MDTIRRYPLGDGRSIRYALPADGLTAREVIAFALHLFTRSRDYDQVGPMLEAWQDSRGHT